MPAACVLYNIIQVILESKLHIIPAVSDSVTVTDSVIQYLLVQITLLYIIASYNLLPWLTIVYIKYLSICCYDRISHMHGISTDMTDMLYIYQFLKLISLYIGSISTNSTGRRRIKMQLIPMSCHAIHEIVH